MKKLTIIFSVVIVAIVFIIVALFLFMQIKYPLKYSNEINSISNNYGIDADLVASVINAESGFNKNAISSVNAVGLMQLMPTTAEFIANKNHIDYDQNKLTEVDYNVELGVLYLKYLFNKFKDERTVLYAYNAGEGCVNLWLNMDEYSNDGKLISSPYKESNNYVTKIQNAKNIYKKRLGLT